MTPDTRLLFYGDSIFLAGLKAELATAADNSCCLHLLTLSAETSGALEWIHDYQPQAILFDLTAPTQPDFVIPLLRQQPDLLLIGLHPGAAGVLILSGQTVTVGRLADLLAMIRREVTTPCGCTQ